MKQGNPTAGPLRGLVKAWWRLAVVGAGAVLVLACATQATEKTFLQADDLATGDQPFDKNAIVDAPSFTDSTSIDAAQVQKFLLRTPYNRPSFLGTYTSNGVLAADAMARSGAAFRINPLVFLVRAEMAQGLIGEQFYPFPPSRVEYVFRCGCSSPTQCDPMLAGFDRQVDCLARALRTSLDEIAANGATAGGWAPGQTSTTLDHESVTPRDESTAALYQYAPIVGVGSSGNWLFWNIWLKYALAAGYDGPISTGTTGTAAIGDPCTLNGDCAVANPFCLTGAKYPGGVCSTSCTGVCPPDAVQGVCAEFTTTTAYCLAACNPSAPTPCRAGYLCQPVQHFGGPPSDTQYACSPGP